MRDRGIQILKLACLVLAAILIVKVVRIAPNINPLADVTMPDLPRLTEVTNALPAGMLGTNAVAKGTNKINVVNGTNSLTKKSTNNLGSNIVGAVSGITTNTNSVALNPVATNSTNTIQPGTNFISTNVVSTNTPTNLPIVTIATNADAEIAGLPHTNILITTNTVGTNVLSGTNGIATNSATSNLVATNLVSTNVITNALIGTNAASTNRARARGTTNAPGATARLARVMQPGGGAPVPDLPPDVKARVNRIYDSEILGQIIHPLPMALMGIAGDSAFLRSASGQTGLVKEGDSLGDLKLLRIGTNRVLVEQAGRKQELMIFQGYGGESLMPGEKETPK